MARKRMLVGAAILITVGIAAPATAALATQGSFLGPPKPPKPSVSVTRTAGPTPPPTLPPGTDPPDTDPSAWPTGPVTALPTQSSTGLPTDPGSPLPTPGDPDYSPTATVYPTWTDQPNDPSPYPTAGPSHDVSPPPPPTDNVDPSDLPPGTDPLDS
jgi:hypothetical protein